MTINIIEKKRKMMGWCPYSSAKIIKIVQLERIDEENTVRTVPPSIEAAVLWFSRLFGVLNLPIAFIAIIDGSLIFTLLNPSHIPETAEQWMGFLTAISAVVGVVAGLTAKSNHSIGRKMIHLLFATLGVVMTFNMLVRQPLFVGWL